MIEPSWLQKTVSFYCAEADQTPTSAVYGANQIWEAHVATAAVTDTMDQEQPCRGSRLDYLQTVSIQVGETMSRNP